MEQHKVRSYILYAIGEVFLVVIGILIAVQVNNWNEKRLNNKYSTIILKEIYRDLSSDQSLIFRGVEPRLKRMELGLSRIRRYMIKETAPLDSFAFYYDYMKYSFLLTQQKGGYESLKLKGLDIIENDSLRGSLVQFYESTLPRYVYFTNGYDKELEAELNELEKSILSFRFEDYQNEKGEAVTVHVPYFITDDYLTHPVLHLIYKILSEDISNKRNRLNILKGAYEKVMNQIEDELDGRNVAYTKFDNTKVIPQF
jgi:hypothetical protein